MTDNSIHHEFDSEVNGWEKEWNIELHGTMYNVFISVKLSMLTLDVEAIESCDRWSNDFTAQYIEEITQKAGNFKKFGVFVKMLASAFSKESESVFADVLTYSDLEMLKARKLGAPMNENRPSLSTKSHLKRYVILTYAGEFDRVHFPLPLAFQDDSNVEALKRTVQRLRRRFEQTRSDDILALEKNKDRQIISQLRQENTELRHKLRQLESRSYKLQATSNTQSTAELASSNVKLRRHVDALKKEINDLTVMHEKYRIDATKEISKWKQRCVDQQVSKADVAKRYGSPVDMNDMRSKEDVIRNLRKRISELEKNQFFERQYRGQKSAIATPTSSRRPSSADLSSNRRASSPTVRRPSPSFLQGKTNRTPIADLSYSRSSPRPRSSSPSQRLSGALDQTRYQLDKSRQAPQINSRPLSTTKSGRSASPQNIQPRYARESGYSSNGSQSSVGSRRSTSPAGSVYSRRSSRASERQLSSDESDSSYNHHASRRKTRNVTEPKLNQRTEGIAIPASQRITGDLSRVQIDRNKPSNRKTNKNIEEYQPKENVQPQYRDHANRVIDSRGMKESSPPSRSIEESLRQLSQSIDRSDSSLRASRESSKTPTRNSADLSDIDKRIHALQSFLDSARAGIISSQSGMQPGSETRQSK